MSVGSETTTPSNPEPSIEILDRYLEQCLERVLDHAPVPSPAALARLLPDDVPPTHHRLLLIEMIKMDMSVAAESGVMRPIEDYVGSLSPPLSIHCVSLDLVMEERLLLKSIGQDAARPIKDRFPHLADLPFPLGDSVEVTAAIKGTQTPEVLSTGAMIDDFLIVRGLGSGAFAHVYLAKQISMQRLVALKISQGTGGESQTLAQLDHPNIVRVFDQRSGIRCDGSGAKADRTQRGGKHHLLYMQYVPGGTLADVVRWVRDGGAVAGAPLTGDALLRCVDHQLLNAAQQVPERSPVRDWLSQASWASVVAWIGIQLARALDEAHANDVLHRDVKPANVLLSAEGIPKLADFNVSFAGAAGRAGAAVNFGGSIAYMAPEHLQAVSATCPFPRESVGPRADLYSLGVLLWELWQGTRPFQVPPNASSWTEMLHQQIESRSVALATPVRGSDPSERVLESALRQTLRADLDARPQTGSELAARLKLALHPEVAGIFDPPPESHRAKLLEWSPRVLAALIILTPNVTAGVFNYFYNQIQIIEVYSRTEPSFESAFKSIALVVNLVAFPTGAALMLWFTQSLVTAIQRARRGDVIPPSAIEDALQLCRRAALIGGLLWIVAGTVYPTVLRWLFPAFDSIEAIHFFMSLLICGGVAAVYPFFGMMWLVTKTYYPRFQRDQLSDDQFESRAAMVTRHCRIFLLAAAIIPLVGVTLLLSRSVIAKEVMFVAVIASIAGLFAALFAFERIVGDWRKMAIVLGNPTSHVVPATDPL